MTRLERLASEVENDWAQSALARVENEDDIGMSCSSPCCCLYSHTMLQHPSLVRLR